MRTVSFSHAGLRRLLNREFVNTYVNTEGDPTAGQSIWHSPREPAGQCIRGNGQQNVQTLFMTPTGQIFHAATGFLSAEDLGREAEFALELFRSLQKESDSDAELIRREHRERLAKSGFSDDQIQASGPRAMMMMMEQSSMDSPRSVFDGMIRRQFLSDQQFPPMIGAIYIETLFS